MTPTTKASFSCSVSVYDWGAIVATFSRRVAVLALGSATAFIAGIGGPIASAVAADPITAESAPTLTGPANDPGGTTPLKDVVLDWTPVEHAASYQVQVSPNGDWTNNTVTLPDNGITVNDLYEMPLSLPHASYFWRVRALGSAGGHTAYSSVHTFLRDWVAPITMLTTPSSADPSLSWAPVPDASLYRVRFGTKADFTGTNFTCFTTATSFTPYAVTSATDSAPGGCFDEGQLTDGKDYFWELIAYDDSSAAAITADTANDSNWECAETIPECDAAIQYGGSFTFQSAKTGSQSGASVTGLKTSWHTASTTNDCTGGTCPVTPTFSWDPVAGANFYRVHVYRDPYFSNTYRVFTTSRPELTPRGAFFDAQAGTPYFWTVEAGWCRSTSTDNQCSQSTAGTSPKSPSCADSTNATPAPSIAPDGLAPTTMSAGDAQTITLDGANFAPSACVQASDGAGLISNINVVSSSQITFDYVAPDSEQGVTFTVVNPDGGTSNASPTLAVSGNFDKTVYWAASGVAAFQKQSDSVSLAQPAAGTTTNARSVTFSWSDFQATGGAGAQEARNYRLQVATDADFENVVWDVNSIDMTRYTNPTALLRDGHWYWRVQPIDGSGNDLTWSSARQFTKDSTPPVFTLTDSSPVAVTAPLHVSVNDAALQGAVSQSSLHVVPVVGGGSPVSGKWLQVAANKWTFAPSGALVPGQSYALSVVPGTISDQSGNDAITSSRTVRTSGRADDNNKAWHYGSGWKQVSASGALGGTFHRGIKGATATLHVVGKTLSVYACKAPHSGRLSIKVDGTTRAAPSLAQSFTKCGLLVYRGAVTTNAAHTVRITAARGPVELDRVNIS
jgi:hypothetical protein